MTAGITVLGVADSDSYIKWGAAVLDRMPADWRTSLTLIGTPATPSAAQLASALTGSGVACSPLPVALDAFAALVAEKQPDVLFLAVRGPVVRVLVRAAVAAMDRRPVIVTGLPGISIPATRKALYYRAQADYFLLHSRRETREFADLAEELGVAQSFGLATLPFLSSTVAGAPGKDVGDARRDLVFAAQAKVPRERDDREHLLDLLEETARRHPELRVVVKLRGAKGEPQTHAEKYPFDVLLAARSGTPQNLVIDRGPMSRALASAAGLVTVSSTAAIEAAAEGVPVIALTDYGIGPDLINTVFEGSGLLADSSALLDARFAHPKASWLDDNYFHPRESEDWVSGIEVLVLEHRRSPLPLRRQFRGTLGGSLRRVWDRKRALGPFDRSIAGALALGIGRPLRWAVLALRAAGRLMGGAPPREYLQAPLERGPRARETRPTLSR